MIDNLLSIIINLKFFKIVGIALELGYTICNLENFASLD